MIPYFPKIFAQRAITMYLVLMAAVLLLFRYPMAWYMYVIGIVGVCCFFHFSAELTKGWGRFDDKQFENRLFSTSLIIRVCFVVFSFFFYKSITGIPFDFGAADAIGYHETGMDIVKFGPGYLFVMSDFDDWGYPIWLSLIYRLTGNSIFIVRLIKALLSAFTVVLMYRIAKRNIGENASRITAIFCMLMPNLIWYSGSHLKETELLFLIVLSLERFDYMMNEQKPKAYNLIIAILACIATMFFRRIVPVVIILSVLMALVFSSKRIKRIVRRTILVTLGIGFIGAAVWAGITDQFIDEDYSNITEQQEANMAWRAERAGGNAFAKYAGAAVFAPMIFTLPFPTMVNIPEQETQQMIHSGNVVKNVISFFTILAMFYLLFSGRWRKCVLPLSFLLGYLIVLVFSHYAQSERFHIPALPFVLMFASYGLCNLKRKHVRWYDLWVILIFVIGIGWQWFKLKGRGM